MFSTENFIVVTEKAANVCSSCRVRKQKCDRSLPQCNRCARKNRGCDYTPHAGPSCNRTPDPEPLVLHHARCGHFDLSERGSSEILHAVAAGTGLSTPMSSQADLAELVSHILDLAEVDLASALEEYKPCIHQWCPSIAEHFLRGCAGDLSQQRLNDNGPKGSLLWLSLWLVTRRSCEQHDRDGSCQLYRCLKQTIPLLQELPESHLLVFQLGMMITVYEIGHGLSQRAFQTFASTTATLRLLEIKCGQENGNAICDMIHWLKSSVLILDRFLSLSMVSNILPLIIYSYDAISTSIQCNLAPEVPPLPPARYATSPRKVHIRSAVSLACGHALEYIHARQHDSVPAEPYEQVDDTMNACIHMLVDKPLPHTWLQCDAIAMGFCTHLILKFEQVRYLSRTLPHTSTLEARTPEYIKACLALKHSRRMAWDMVLVAISIMHDDQEISRLPLMGLCCVLRAGIAVIEAREFVDEDLVELRDLEGFIRILGWFAARWKIGEQYMRTLDRLLETPGNLLVGLGMERNIA